MSNITSIELVIQVDGQATLSSLSLRGKSLLYVSVEAQPYRLVTNGTLLKQVTLDGFTGELTFINGASALSAAGQVVYILAEDSHSHQHQPCNPCGQVAHNHRHEYTVGCHCNSCSGRMYQIKASDVFYDGCPLNTIDANRGDNLATIICKIDEYLGNLSPVSGEQYVGQSGEIVISNQVIGIDPSYTQNIENQFNTINNSINNLSSCVSGSITSVVSTNPQIVPVVTPNPSGCGNVLTLNASLIPAGIYGGITKVQTTPVLNIPNAYFVSLNLVTPVVGDVLVFESVLQRNTAMNSDQTYTLTDGVTNLSFPLVHQNSILSGKLKVNVMEVKAVVVSTTPTTITLNVVGSFKTSYTPTLGFPIIAQDTKIIDFIPNGTYTFLTASLGITYTHTDTPTLVNFTSEIKKKL